MKKYISFDIGGTAVKHGIVNENGDVLCKGSFKTLVSSDNEFLGTLVKQIEEYKGSYEVDGIAISMPGFIDPKRGIPTVCYAINCMEGKSITRILEEKTGLRTSVENDGNCVALAEKFNGNASECSDFVVITIGTGIGGGIYLNNKMLRGHSFKAGEFGFMISNGLTDNNKNQATFSTNGATLPLINRYKEYKGIEAEVDVDGQDVFKEADCDENVKNIIEEWYKNIAISIFNLCATLNPQKILIGGGVSAREDFISSLNKALDNIPWWNDVKTEICICKHKNDAGLIGAVYHHINE